MIDAPDAHGIAWFRWLNELQKSVWQVRHWDSSPQWVVFDRQPRVIRRSVVLLLLLLLKNGKLKKCISNVKEDRLYQSDGWSSAVPGRRGAGRREPRYQAAQRRRVRNDFLRRCGSEFDWLELAIEYRRKKTHIKLGWFILRFLAAFPTYNWSITDLLYGWCYCSHILTLGAGGISNTFVVCSIIVEAAANGGAVNV